jgi:hypothetical protein
MQASWAQRSGANRWMAYSQVASDRLGEGQFGLAWAYQPKPLGGQAMVGVSSQSLPSLASLGSPQAKQLNSQLVELGGIYPLSGDWQAFARISWRQLEDSDATLAVWGLTDAKAKSESLGLSWQNESSRLAFGVHQPEALSSGQMTLVTPAGRDQSGQVYWKTLTLDVSPEKALPWFMAWQKSWSAKSRMNLGLNQSAVDAKQVEGQLTFDFAF